MATWLLTSIAFQASRHHHDRPVYECMHAIVPKHDANTLADIPLRLSHDAGSPHRLPVPALLPLGISFRLSTTTRLGVRTGETHGSIRSTAGVAGPRNSGSDPPRSRLRDPLGCACPRLVQRTLVGEESLGHACPAGMTGASARILRESVLMSSLQP
jgi:hypothetical protein